MGLTNIHAEKMDSALPVTKLLSFSNEIQWNRGSVSDDYYMGSVNKLCATSYTIK